MKPEARKSLKSFVVELGLYALAVAVYFGLVLHYLGGWLYELFKHERHLYAAVALGLIVGQGILLEVVTRVLLAFINPRTED